MAYCPHVPMLNQDIHQYRIAGNATLLHQDKCTEMEAILSQGEEVELWYPTEWAPKYLISVGPRLVLFEGVPCIWYSGANSQPPRWLGPSHMMYAMFLLYLHLVVVEAVFGEYHLGKKGNGLREKLRGCDLSICKHVDLVGNIVNKTKYCKNKCDGIIRADEFSA
eukprot:5522019-Ditylum_brightwellii.AAC.1